MKKFKVIPSISSSRNEYVFGDARGREEETIYIGRMAELGPNRKVYLDVSGEHVIAIVGKRGSGKSYTLGSLVEGLCTRRARSTISKISRRRSILLFDTLNIFWTTAIKLVTGLKKEVLKKQADQLRGWEVEAEDLDIQIWVPAGYRSPGMPSEFRDFGVNVPDFSAEDWGALLDVDVVQDRMGQLVNDAYSKVTHEGWSGSAGSRAPNLRYSIHDLLDCVKGDAEIQRSYHPETIRAVVQQLTHWNRSPVLSSSGTSLNALLVPGTLSVLLTASLPEELRAVLVAVMTRKLMQGRSEASFDKKRLLIDPSLTGEEEREIYSRLKESIPPTWVVVDEAQNVIPSGRSVTSRRALTRLVKEGRNFGVSFAFTTQQPSAIDNQIMSQVDTLIIHKLAVQGDIDEVRRNLKCNEPGEVRYGSAELGLANLLRSLDTGQVVVSSTEVERNFIMDVRPRVSAHGGFEA